MTVKKEPKKVIFHDSFNICLMTLLSLRKSASIEFVLRINKIPEILGRFTCVAYFLQCTGSITFMPIFLFMPRGGLSSRMTKIQINFTKLDIWKTLEPLVFQQYQNLPHHLQLHMYHLVISISPFRTVKPEHLECSSWIRSCFHDFHSRLVCEFNWMIQFPLFLSKRGLGISYRSWPFSLSSKTYAG